MYDVILADPPWTFSVWNADKSDRHASHKYSLMTAEDICALPIAALAAENCALFMTRLCSVVIGRGGRMMRFPWPDKRLIKNFAAPKTPPTGTVLRLITAPNSHICYLSNGRSR